MADTFIADFETELKSISRKGVKELMEYLKTTDFFESPASTRFHGAVEGGLAFHSLSVLDVAKHLNEILEPTLSNNKYKTCFY